MPRLCPTVAWAASVDVASSTDRLVLLTLATLLGGEVEGRVTQGEIASAARLSDRTVRTSLLGLEDAGLLALTRQPGMPHQVRLSLGAQPRKDDPPPPERRSAPPGSCFRVGSCS